MRYNKKAIYVWVIKVVAFMLIFLMLFHGATDLLRTKSQFSSVSPIYDLPKNSVDILFLGSSHMACTISPMDLWKDYGITSFNAGIYDQTIPVSYFELRELLKVQKPKVVVMEIYYIFCDQIIVESKKERLHWFVDNVPLSLGISEAIQTLVQEDYDKTEYYLNFYSFHNRWKELSKEDFRPLLGYNRGAAVDYYPLHSTKESPVIIPRNETKVPPELPLEYLDKIVELCHENNIQLVLMAQPYSASSDIQKMMNYVDTVAEMEEVPFINFFYLLDETGLDFAKDMTKDNHINYFGTQKLTSYLGEYLQTNYQLEDHRNDPTIADLWNKDYETFARELNNTMMKTAQTPDEYFNYLQNQDYIIAWNAYSKTPLSETSLPDFFKAIGIQRPIVKEKQYYYAVTKGNQLLYKKALYESQRPDDSYMTDDTLFSFGPGITGSTNPIGVHVGRYEYSVGNTGLNLAVYDPVSRAVVDNVNIDLETGEIKRK